MQRKSKKPKENREVKRTTSNFHVEMDKILGGISLSVCGVKNILNFTSEEVVLKLDTGKIKVSGFSLDLIIYENKTVEVVGKILRVELL